MNCFWRFPTKTDNLAVKKKRSASTAMLRLLGQTYLLQNWRLYIPTVGGTLVDADKDR